MKNPRLSHFLFMMIVSATILLVGCGTETKEMLVLSLTGVEPLANDYHYEGWAIIGGEAKSTGKFNVDTLGNIIDTDGAEIANGEFDVGFDMKDATAIVISIEPAGDTDEIPSSTKFLAGDVADDKADLMVEASQALGDDFMTAAGKYILATPTNGDTTNELSGIWFLDLGTGTPAVGLTLPTIPAGWKYEGWAVISGQPVTSGKFISVDAADDAAPYSGPLAGPPFPGEDYLENAPAGLTFPTDLSGGTVVISVEPEPDDDAAPFAIKPLLHQVPDPAQDHTTYDMTNQANTIPTGKATIQ